MNVTLELSSREIDELKQLTRREDDGEAIAQAARAFLRLSRLRELKAAAGKVDFDASAWQEMEALEETESASLQDVVAGIQAMGPNPSCVRAATSSLANVLLSAPGDPSFDLGTWTRQWAAVEAELKTTTRANDIAEGRER